MAIIFRGNSWCLRRRTPKRFARVESRDTIWLALATDSRAVAEQKALIVWAELEAAWEAKLRCDDAEADDRIASAKNLAAMRGFQYLPAAKVAELPLDQLIARIEAVVRRNGKPDVIEAEALLGGAANRDMTVSRALDRYWTDARDKIMGKSPDQVRRWKNPRIKAVANFIAAVDDKALQDVTTEDLFTFRSWWVDRLVASDVTANSANKDMIHFLDVLKTVTRAKGLKLTVEREGLMIDEGKPKTRLPFSDDWIRTKIMAPGALDGMNLEARCLLLGMINTGYRPSEAAQLGKAQIRLDANVPHIKIEAVGRTLKTDHAERSIPLTGISLEAFRACPDGFPRYADKAGLSDTINKFMRANGLAETPGHTMYGLRHSFEDRMLRGGIDERIRRDLMGHALNRERYGDGGGLGHVQGLLAAIAL